MQIILKKKVYLTTTDAKNNSSLKREALFNHYRNQFEYNYHSNMKS